VKTRSFGGHPFRVSEIGLGCAGLSPFSRGMRFTTAQGIIGRSLERGVTFFDTADSYGAGWGERWLGRSLGAQRGDVVIATKCGLPASVTGKFVSRAVPDTGWLTGLTSRARGSRFSPSYIKLALEGSLRRLGTEYVDVLMLHNPPTDVLEIGGWAEAMDALKRAGLVRTVGISARTPEDAATAIREYGVDCIELELNARTVSRAQPTLDIAAECGTAVIARQVLGSGSLLNSVAAQLGKVSSVALKRDTAAALIQTVLEIPAVSVVLVGMLNVDQVEWNTAPRELSLGFVERVWNIARQVC